jgi:hypothetical protein
MKKIIIIFMFLGLGCATTFNYTIINKSIVNNPSFAIFVGGENAYNNDWLCEQIENTLIGRKLSVISLNPTVNTQTTTTKGFIGLINPINLRTETNPVTSVDLSMIKATYLIYANYDLYTFKIILVKTQEIVAIGTFTGNSHIKENINIVLNEMGVIDKKAEN